MTDEPEAKRAKGMGVRYAYETIRDEILDLTLDPGQLLDETSLAERFGMSRSPVREALIRLAGEELVVTLANRSTIVAPIDVQSFPKYVEALDIAQRMNTRLAAELRTDADLQAIAARQHGFVVAVGSGRHLAMSEANKAFHMAIATAGRNPYLASFYERLLNQGRRMLHLHFRYLEAGNEGHLLTDEHDEMLAAIRDRDVERADTLAHLHTRQFRDNFIDFMTQGYLTDARLLSIGQPSAAPLAV
ncbi:GntR family transcriptional regulator [Tabrizicola sp. BL-A-41-H6]|uniref:GntR family transcriptional regulator n=1 Tax=Tabrizicola sp. BL-A-41-H6 TaxID=3421107 RepID=UPI003D673D39